VSVTDLTADMLVMLINAQKAGKQTVEIKKSTMLESIVKILKDEGFISNYAPIEDNKQGLLKVYLKYFKDKSPAMLGVKKVSVPSLKKYVPAKKIPRIYGGVGIAILSTSKGLLTDQQAREQKVGGELICNVW